MRVLGSWGMNINGNVDFFVLKLLANTTFLSRDTNPKNAFKSAMRKLKVENRRLTDNGKDRYGLVTCTLLYLATGICGFLDDGYRFPEPCLDHL